MNVNKIENINYKHRRNAAIDSLFERSTSLCLLENMGTQLSTILNNKNQMLRDATHKRENISGEHETHVSDGSEGELHTRNVVCEKNPGHVKFIPVDKFSLQLLPKGHHNNDWHKYIKAAADLTVKVNVYLTSPHRPEFWPKTNNPYPFYNMREQEGLRTGSGMMLNVKKHTAKLKEDFYGCEYYTHCWCRKCEYSDSPSNVWWEFNVETATHVVFDSVEAKHTSLKLFYDNKESPLVIVDKVSVDIVDVEDDTCVLKCVTCDKILGDKLKKMWKHYDDIGFKVESIYKSSISLNKWTFIVSHPHGCTKQISVGKWINKYKVGILSRMFTYTTCTCQGSSGARVHCVGDRKWRWSLNGPVHSGTNSEHRYNYSGVW